MNWTLKLYYNSEFIDVNPILNGITLTSSKEQDQIFNRIKSSGIAIFFENDFDYIYNLSLTNRQILAYLYCDEVLQTINYLQLDGTYDLDKKIVELEFVVVDKYYKVLEDYTTETNILTLDANLRKYNVLCDLTQNKLEFLQIISLGEPIPGNGYVKFSTFFSGAAGGSYWIFARQKFTFNTYEEAAILDGSNGWSFLSGTTNTLVRSWLDAFPEYVNILTPSKDLPDEYFYDYPYVELPYDTQYPNVNKNISDFTVVCSDTDETTGFSFTFLLKNRKFYDTTGITYSRNILLKDVIILLFNHFDNTILFDENSFNYFDKNDKFKYLFISNITDFMLETDTDTLKRREKDSPAVISNMSISIIFSYLRELFSLYWYIDDNNYFRLVHILDYTYNPVLKPCHDLTTNRGINWSIANNKYTIDRSEQYSQIKRIITASSPDFIGKNLEYPNIKKNLKEITLSSIFTDINDTQLFPSKYPDTSNNQFILLSCEPVLYNMIYMFTNDTTYPFEKLNGVALSAGHEIITGQFENLENTSGTGILKSNYFTLQKGETIRFSFDLTYYTNLAYVILYDKDILLKYIEIQEGTFEYTCINSSVYGNLRIECNPGIYSFSNINLTISNQFGIRKNAGILSAENEIQNIELALSYADYYDFAEHSDTDVEINGELVTVDSSMIKKFKEQNNLTTPTNNFANDFDSLQYVKTDLTETGIIKEITKKLDNSLSKITLKFYE